MKRIIFEIIKACLLGVLFLCVGLYVGTNKERKEQAAGVEREETVDIIAVVNLDEGADIDGTKINYGRELGVFPNENYVNASLEEARSGILNGTYGAFIVIPPSFSDAVESINEFPQKAELSYTINPNLSDATKLIVTEEVVEYLSSMNDTLSYVYVTSIMSEFHDVQDGSKIILEHDIEDLNNIISIDPGKLSTDIEYTPLQQTDYKWEYVDLSEYSDRNEEYINNIDKYYEEVHQKLSEKYKEIDDGAKSAAQQYADVKSQIGAFDPFNDEAGNSVLDGGFARLETEVARTDEDSIRYAIDNMVSEQARIEMGYYRNQLQKYVDEQMLNYIATQQKSINDWLDTNHPGESYTLQMRSGFESEIAGVNVDNLSDDAKCGNIVLSNFSPSMDDIGNDYPILVREGELTDEEQEEKNNIISQLINNTGISGRFKNETLHILVPARATITQILKEDIVDKAKATMESQLTGIDTQLDGVVTSIDEECTKIMEYNPFGEISASTAQENVSEIRNKNRQMQMTVNEKTTKDTETVGDIYMKSEENIRTLKEDMKTANDTTESNVQTTIDALKEAREGINSENTEILSDFSDRLSYTRLGSLENEQAYDFIVEPIGCVQEMSTRTIAERIVDDNMELLVVAAAIAVIYISCIIAEAVYTRKRANVIVEE